MFAPVWRTPSKNPQKSRMPNKIMTFTIWIILLCMTKLTKQEQAVVQSWCSVNEAYEGDETTLTCSFDQDVSTLKQNILLQHKTANGFEDILVYDWAVGRDLFKRQDYQVQLEGTVTNSLNANMHVNLKHAGYYRCVVGASEGKECLLIIKDHEAATLSPFIKTLSFGIFLFNLPLLVIFAILLKPLWKAIMEVLKRLWKAITSAICHSKRNHGQYSLIQEREDFENEGLKIPTLP